MKYFLILLLISCVTQNFINTVNGETGYLEMPEKIAPPGNITKPGNTKTPSPTKIPTKTAKAGKSSSASAAASGKCRANEVWVSCANPCPMTCSMIINAGPYRKCAVPNPCPSGCDCILGYVRDASNACVMPEQCPCPDRNAVVVRSPSPCQMTCDDIFDQSPCPIPPFLEYGCICRPGYVLNWIGKCILISNCIFSGDRNNL